MKKITLTLLASFMVFLSFGQMTESQKMIELGQNYKDFMFRNEPTKQVFKEIKSDVPTNLKEATEFIVQTISSNNKLLSQSYLSRPDDKVLKQIYIIREINSNLREENRVDNNKLIDSLSKKEVPTYELVNNYYGMLFIAVGNKNQPFNLAKTDLRLNSYNLKDETEKGILFLRAFSLCGDTIWGFMNLVDPPNTEKALDHIKKFPRINGRPYYQYTDFYFPDFEMKIIKDEDIQSYKSFYLHKFYETLLSHLICLNKENGTEKEINDLLLGSILKERNLYKFTKHQELLENIFKAYPRD